MVVLGKGSQEQAETPRNERSNIAPIKALFLFNRVKPSLKGDYVTELPFGIDCDERLGALSLLYHLSLLFFIVRWPFTVYNEKVNQGAGVGGTHRGK